MASQNNTLTTTPKKLKIAVLLRRFITTGGAERYAVEVARQIAVDHDIHVFAQEWALEGNENITFHKVPKFFTKPSFLNMLVFSFFTAKYLDRSFDIIHSHERVANFDILTIHCPCFKTFLTEEIRRWKKVMLWLSIALSPRKIAYLWMEKQQFTYSNNRLLIAVSKKVKQNVQENYSLPDNYFVLAYPGVNIDFGITNMNRDVMRLELGIGKNDTAILFVGTEFKRKGLDSLIKGLSLIMHSNVKLIIAGGGKQKDYISLAEELGIEKDIVFLGLVKDIASIYPLSDIFILPTLSDPAAMSPLEAMASGVATIMSSSKYNGCAEHITKGEALILENPDNPQEIAKVLEKLIDANCRQQMIVKGRELANQLSWKNTTEQTLSAYYKILDLKTSLH
jgi:glycosyltransferase involved in cell wall biosynthesis